MVEAARWNEIAALFHEWAEATAEHVRRLSGLEGEAHARAR